MKLGKKKGRQPTTVTPAYMPRIMVQLQEKKYDEAMETLGDAARDYFARLSKATETVNSLDAAILVKLFRHMASEMERADPQAARIVEAMEKITLPPIEYGRRK